MIVHTVTLEPPTDNRPSLRAMARVRTDRGTFVFAAMHNGRINVASFRYNGGWHPAFTLCPEDENVCHEAIRHEIENEAAPADKPAAVRKAGETA